MTEQLKYNIQNNFIVVYKGEKLQIALRVIAVLFWIHKPHGNERKGPSLVVMKDFFAPLVPLEFTITTHVSNN